MRTIILSLLLYLPLTLFADNAKLEEHYNDLGVNNLDRIKKGLLNNGISESQLDPVLRGMIRLIKSAKVDGKSSEMNPRMKIYFERRVGLNQEQIQNVMDMSVRISNERSYTTDVTEEFIDLTARVNNLKATESQLVKLLEKAEKIEDILAIQRELTSMRGQIESLEGRINYINRTSSTSLISITLSPTIDNKPIYDKNWTPINTIKSALRGLSGFFEGFLDLLIWIAIFSPVWLIISGLTLFIYKHTRKRFKKS